MTLLDYALKVIRRRNGEFNVTLKSVQVSGLFQSITVESALTN
jgi:hypothetical protein